MINLNSGFRRIFGLHNWLIPIGLALIVIAYEVGPSRWIYNSLGFTYHLMVEILLFGTVGPALALLLLQLLGRWMEERDTADFQATLLAKAKKKELEVRQINDDTLQVLFATTLLITTFKADQSDLQPNTATQIEATEQALHEAMHRLRSQLVG